MPSKKITARPALYRIFMYMATHSNLILSTKDIADRVHLGQNSIYGYLDKLVADGILIKSKKQHPYIPYRPANLYQYNPNWLTERTELWTLQKK